MNVNAPLSADDLATAERYLAQRTGSPCPRCGDGARPSLMPLLFDLGGPSGGDEGLPGALGLPAVATVCGRCGHLAFHAAAVVLAP